VLFYLQRIQLTFTDFDLEDHAQCSWDYVEVKDGNVPTDTPLGKFCGKARTNVVESTGNYLYVKMKTDNVNGGAGFRATVSSIRNGI